MIEDKETKQEDTRILIADVDQDMSWFTRNVIDNDIAEMLKEWEKKQA